MIAPFLLRAALHAGVAGTWHGGHPGDPRVGLSVIVPDEAALHLTLAALARRGVQATLLLPAPLFAAAAQATPAGHELAGLGPPRTLAWLDVQGGQPVTTWGTPGTLPELLTLRRLGLHPLPPGTRDTRAAPGDREAAGRQTASGQTAGGDAAPGGLLQVTAAELDSTLDHLTRLGYRPVPVRDVPELRAGQTRDLLLRAYTRLVEDRFARAHHLIDLTQRADAVMRVAPLDHAPSPLPLPPGTPTAELHLHSPRIVGLASRGALTAYRAYLRSLRDVAAALDRPELRGAQAVFAVTLFHAPLAQAGFTLLDLPPARARWYGLGFRVLRAAYGTRRAPSENTPRMAWMPRDEFLRRYGSGGAGQAVR